MSTKRISAKTISTKGISTKNKIVVSLLAVFILFALSPVFPYLLSMGVMTYYSGEHEKESIISEEGIELKIPGGNETEEKDWYPFVMTYNPGQSFRNFVGDNSIDLTILYNFPAFDFSKGCSMLFDSQSKYYNSFYGAYLVKNNDENKMPYGFLPDGSLDTEKISMVPRYDYQRLVLRDFGIKPEEEIFNWEVVKKNEDVTYVGYEGWTKVDAKLTVNGCQHRKKDFVTSYLQYGIPKYEITEAFKPVEMSGRVYAKYFPQWKTSVFFYVLTMDSGETQRCDRKLLSKSILREKE